VSNGTKGEGLGYTVNNIEQITRIESPLHVLRGLILDILCTRVSLAHSLDKIRVV